MALEPERFGQLAMALLEDMENQHGADASLTAMVAIVAVKAPDGTAHISFRAADGDGDGMAPWHFRGLLSYVEEQT